MSRKWERMVQKNSKTVNKSRAKQGKPPVSESASDGSVTIRGRSWMFPALLFCIGIFSFIAFRGTAHSDNLYWVTGSSYIALSLFIFFVRRPFLKIGKDYLVTRRFSGDKRVNVEQIKEILIQKDAVVISVTTMKSKWIFTKLFQQVDIAALSEQLQQFAQRNAIAIKSEQ